MYRDRFVYAFMFHPTLSNIICQVLTWLFISLYSGSFSIKIAIKFVDCTKKNYFKIQTDVAINDYKVLLSYNVANM